MLILNIKIIKNTDVTLIYVSKFVPDIRGPVLLYLDTRMQMPRKTVLCIIRSDNHSLKSIKLILKKSQE